MFLEVFSALCSGFLVSCEIFVLTLVFALPLGLIIAFGTMSRFRVLRAVLKTFVWIIRGTPLMLQIMFIYYGPGAAVPLAGDGAPARGADRLCHQLRLLFF